MVIPSGRKIVKRRERERLGSVQHLCASRAQKHHAKMAVSIISWMAGAQNGGGGHARASTDGAAVRTHRDGPKLLLQLLLLLLTPVDEHK